MAAYSEQVKFRLLVMPCCRQQVCWVNPRIPNYCPECGKFVYLRIRDDQSLTLLCDTAAMLRIHDRREA